MKGNREKKQETKIEMNINGESTEDENEIKKHIEHFWKNIGGPVKVFKENQIQMEQRNISRTKLHNNQPRNKRVHQKN